MRNETPGTRDVVNVLNTCFCEALQYSFSLNYSALGNLIPIVILSNYQETIIMHSFQ